MADVDVDEMLVADPRALAHDLEELAAAEHHTRPAGQGFQDVEFGAGEQDRFLVEAYFAGINVDAQRSEPPRRGGRVLARAGGGWRFALEEARIRRRRHPHGPEEPMDDPDADSAATRQR